MKVLLPIIIVIIVALGGWYYIAQPKAPLPAPVSGGDGTIIPAPTNSGINGTVTAGPTCPVERDPPDPACADKLIATNISIYPKDDPTRGVAFTTSDSQGKFVAALPPGVYIIMAGSSGVQFPRCTDATVTVTSGRYSNVSVSCDTGIR